MADNHSTINKITKRPLFSGRAVFHDETQFFRSPVEAVSGDLVKVKLRTLKDNVDKVILVTKTGDALSERELTEKKVRGDFDFYLGNIDVGEEIVAYWFSIVRDEKTIIFDRMGIFDGDVRAPFKIVPGYHVPKWAQESVMYQIFADRFRNGNPENDVESGEYSFLMHETERAEWDSLPKEFDVTRFYGGDLEGVTGALPYLKEMGIDAIYLNPIFTSPSNHKYDTTDYNHVDPHLGGDEALKELIEKAHALSIKIILDGVFNHCGSECEWFKEAMADPGSLKRNFFWFDENGKPEYWWGNENLPKLAYENSEELVDTMLGVAKKWISPPYDADGWRLDVAADLGHSAEYNHHFWSLFRKAVREKKKEALILAEHYGDPESYLQGEWDTVMNYDAFMDPVSYFLTGMEKHSDSYEQKLHKNAAAFEKNINAAMAKFGGPSLRAAMNELSNHDHSRFLTRTNGIVGRVATRGSDAASCDVNHDIFKLGVLMQMTWPGAPTIYYGDEAGVTGFTDPDSRRTYPWGKEDKDILAFTKEMIGVRKSSDAFSIGSFKFLGCAGSVVTFGRFTNDEQYAIIVNAGEKAKVAVPAWEMGLKQNAIFSLELIKGCGTVPCEVSGIEGVASFEVGECSAGVYKVKLQAPKEPTFWDRIRKETLNKGGVTK